MKHILKITVILTSLALIGLITTQTLWVIESMKLSKKHFEHRAYVALDGAIDEIKRSTDSTLIQNAEKSGQLPILQIVKPAFLDSLLHKYISFYQLDSVFEFAIVHSANDSVVFSSPQYVRCKNIESYHRHCLSCIYDNDHYHVELFFPNRIKNVWVGLIGWLSVSLVFLLIIILSFGFIVFSVFRHKKLSEMKTDFINNISHEFKTPISTISLASEILINTKTDTNIEKIERYARIIYEENERMRSQVEQVLRITRLEKHETILNFETIDVNELLKTTINNLCLEHNKINPNIVFNLNALNSMVKADSIHLSNIINNLVDNACKYSANNIEIVITSKNIEQSIIFSVRDNGLGISSDKHKLIFDKFYRISTGNIHNVKGFGIGLYYVKTMVDQHQGKVWVKSELGKGSEFFVQLPLA